MLIVDTHRTSKTTIEKITVEFQSHKLSFNGKTRVFMEKNISSFAEATNLFDCQNEFINDTFSLEDKTKLFKLYEKAHKICESTKQIEHKEELFQIKKIIDEIYSLFNVTKFIGFIQYSKHLKIPKNLISATSKGDYPAETTILEDDYVNLVKFIFSTRVIYPILFSLVNRFKPTMGIDYAHLNIGQLVSLSPSLTNLEGWNKLKTYISASFNKHNVSQQLTEFSTGNNIVEKTVHRTILVRLMPSVIPETDVRKNIATNINSSCQTAKNTFSNAFREKEDSYSDVGEDKRSRFEKYQIAEKVNPSEEQAQLEWFSFSLFDENGNHRVNNRFSHQSIAMGVDEKLVEMVYDRIPDNWEYEMDIHVSTLLQLTMFEYISPQSIMSCDYMQLMAAVALAQVKLASMGYRYLPSVLGAVKDPEGLRTIDPLRLNNEDRELLESICSVQAKNTDARSANEAVIDTMNFLETFGNGIWKSNLEVGILDTPEMYKRSSKGDTYPLEINLDIKSEFVDLILKTMSLNK